MFASTLFSFLYDFIFAFFFNYFLVGRRRRRKKKIESVCDGASFFFFLVFVCFSTRIPLRAPITLLPSSKLLFVLICSFSFFFFIQILFHVLCHPYDSDSVVVVKYFFPLFFFLFVCADKGTSIYLQSRARRFHSIGPRTRWCEVTPAVSTPVKAKTRRSYLFSYFFFVKVLVFDVFLIKKHK